MVRPSAAFVVLCRQLNLFSQAVVAVDGSKFMAVNNRDRNFTSAKVRRRLEQIEASINRYMSALARQNRRPARPPCVSLVGRSGPCACLSLHAGLLPGMAHASAPRADAVRRHRQGSCRSTAQKRRSAGAVFSRCSQKADDGPDRRRLARAQLPLAARRSRDIGAQHHHHCNHTEPSA
jgi:hypothetical protein